MKTFREFLEESYLYEMRKEDKVRGEKKTPLHITSTSGRVVKNPETGRSEVKRATRRALSPRASTGRKMQGMIDSETQPYATRMPGAARHAHGGGGSGAAAPGRLRGVKRTETIQQRRERPFNAGPTPAQKVELRRAQRRRSSGGGL